jgi:hypothetical protein
MWLRALALFVLSTGVVLAATAAAVIGTVDAGSDAVASAQECPAPIATDPLPPAPPADPPAVALPATQAAAPAMLPVTGTAGLLGIDEGPARMQEPCPTPSIPATEVPSPTATIPPSTIAPGLTATPFAAQPSLGGGEIEGPDINLPGGY